MIEALRELADELDAVGLRAWGTGALNAGREFTSLMVAAQQRLDKANDNEAAARCNWCGHLVVNGLCHCNKPTKD